MSEDQWLLFRQYEEQQRKIRAEKERLLDKPIDEPFHIQHLAQELHRTDRTRNEAQVTASENLQKAQGQQPKTWQGWDGTVFRSPIEAAFWNAWQLKQEEYPLVCQYKILRYRVDFAHLTSKTVIELDGRQYHTDRSAFTHDRVRQRALSGAGWQVLRFSASEVLESVETCIQATINFLQGR